MRGSFKKAQWFRMINLTLHINIKVKWHCAFKEVRTVANLLQKEEDTDSALAFYLLLTRTILTLNIF